MYNKIKTLKDFNFKDKTVLVRVDINSDVINKKLLMSERIKQSALTIKYLKSKKTKVVVIAHQGRKGKSDFLSLKQHAKLLNKFTKIKFIPDIVGKKAESAILSLKKGEAILLENIRGLNEETSPMNIKNNKFVKKLSSLCNIYVNDAFSVCHREHSSIVEFPKVMESCMGLLLEKELKALEKVKVKNSIYILGGSKPEDNIKLMKGNKILTGGYFSQLCLIARGFDFGYQNKHLKDNLFIVSKLKSKLKKAKIKFPVDYAVNVNEKRVEICLSEFPSKYRIDDIGEKTIQNYVSEIKKAKAVFMKGPMGFAGDKKFSKGTVQILKAISKSKAFSVLGGGHLNDAIAMSKINKNKFNHISLSGGALLRYVAGEKLPGVEVLKGKK